MQKRILLSLLALLLVFSLTACGKETSNGQSSGDNSALNGELTPEDLFAWPAPAAEDSFEFDSDTGTITLYVSSGGAVVIPEEINGVAVTALAESCFYDHSGERDFTDPITAIYIPNSVKTIGTYAFVGNQQLEVLRLPAELTEIPRTMCYLCLGLREISIPQGVTKIDKSAFSVSGLQSIALPAGLEVIADHAFSGCADLVLPELPASLTTIGEKAFADCAYTPYYTIPQGVQSIASNAFSNTVFGLNFPGVYLPADLPELDNANGPVFDTVQLALLAWDVSLEQIMAMDEFLLAQGEGEIAWAMFNPEWEPYVDYEAMTCDDSGTVTAFDHAAGVEDLKVAIPRENKTGEVVLTAIGDSAFESSAVTFVGVNADLRSIGKRAFAGSAIEEIILPIGLEYIGEKAFYDCDYLTSITLTGTISEIAPSTFKYSNNLQSVTLPETVKKIGDEAFSGCGFKTFIVPEGITEIGSAAFTGCTEMESIILPASLQKLGDNAFGNCPSLKSVTFLSTTPPEMSDMSFAFSSIGMDATFYLPKELTPAEFEYFQFYVAMRGTQAGATWEQSK